MQGKNNCIFPDGDTVLRVSKEDVDEASIEREHTVSDMLRETDRHELRFLAPYNFARMSRTEFKNAFPEMYVDYLDCIDHELPSHVWISRMTRAQPIEDLSPAQRAYVRESINILKQMGISHNDIHPDNIMLLNNHPVLIDWETADFSKGDDEKKLEEAFAIMDDRKYKPKRRIRQRSRSPIREGGRSLFGGKTCGPGKILNSVSGRCVNAKDVKYYSP